MGVPINVDLFHTTTKGYFTLDDSKTWREQFRPFFEKVFIFFKVSGLPCEVFSDKVYDFSFSCNLKVGAGVTVEKLRKLAPAISQYSGLEFCTFERTKTAQVVKMLCVVALPDVVGFKHVFFCDKDGANLPICAGLDFESNPVIFDLEKCPHLLIAGTTGSGKSVFLHDILCSLFISRKDFDVVISDPKQVEYNVYKERYTIADNASYTAYLLKKHVEEMERRYKEFAKVGARDISSYEAITGEEIERKIFVVDEMSDLMFSEYRKDIESFIVRLAQMGRACGIHLILATQRPTTDIITGTIKANMPARVAFHLPSGTDSRVILDRTGAETLTGSGDALYLANGAQELKRFKACYLAPDEIQRFVLYLKMNNAF